MAAEEVAISDVAPLNDRRQTLLAIRDRLARETDDTLWSTHKRECDCSCGMGDGRLLVALVKELRAVEAELAGLPAVEGGHPLDGIVASVASLDKHRRTRAPRRSAAAGS
jgi:hypothetical protein